MKNSFIKTCLVCGSKQIKFEEKFFKCKKCCYQTAGVTNYKELQKYYNNSDIGLQVQNILEEGIDSPLRNYHRIATKFIIDNISLKKKTLCDIGCGVGVFLREVRKNGMNPFGYDINKDQTQIARKKYHLTNVSDASSLPSFAKKLHLRKHSFDVITAFEVIEHIPNPRKFIVEAAQYLKIGGYIIISTPNNDRIPINESWDYPPIHLSRFNKNNLSQLLNSEGFEVKQWLSYNELGYYTNNIIHNMSFSKKVLSKVISNTEPIKSKQTKLHIISTIKKYICILLDIPIYLWLLPQKARGHTMVILAQKI